MKHRRIILTSIFGALLPAALHAAESRTWTDQQQRKIEAKMLGLQGDSVLLELKDGRKIPFPLAKLSPEDAAFARSQKDPTPPAAAVTTAPAGPKFDTPWPDRIKFSEDPEIATIEENAASKSFIYESASYRYTSDVRLSKSLIKGFAVMFEATSLFCRTVPLGMDGGQEDDGKLPIRLFETETDYYGAGAPSGSAGVFVTRNGKSEVLVPLTSLGVRKVGKGYMIDRDKSSKTLPHELTHQLTPSPYYETGGMGWFTEGIAEYIATTPYRAGSYSVRNNLDEIINYVTGYGEENMGGRALGKKIQLPALRTFMLQDYRSFLNDPQRNYGSALLITTYFLQMDGQGDASRVKKFLKALREKTTGEAALEVLFDGRSATQVQLEISKAWDRKGVKITFGTS